MKNKIILITGASKGLDLNVLNFLKKYKVIAIGRDKKYIKFIKKITLLVLTYLIKNRSKFYIKLKNKKYRRSNHYRETWL